uniref:Uncharacterized protein n=1 Tax=Lygus hesperus TaxID=30085 RepID=A0A146L806_LYGHE
MVQSQLGYSASGSSTIGADAFSTCNSLRRSSNSLAVSPTLLPPPPTLVSVVIVLHQETKGCTLASAAVTALRSMDTTWRIMRLHSLHIAMLYTGAQVVCTVCDYSGYSGVRVRMCTGYRCL